MSSQSKSRAGAIVSSGYSATDLTMYHQSRLESHQPQSPCERTARAGKMKKEKPSSSNRISFQDTPVCSSSAQRNVNRSALSIHNTPYALYNCSASRLEGFPYRDSLWEAQLKDHPYGRRSYELDRRHESTPARPKADSTRSLSNEGDGSLDSSDADLDLTVELASPDTSYDTPGNPSHPAACSTHSCTGKADFTSISIVNSSTNVGPSTPEPHPVLPLEHTLNEGSPQVPSSPSEMPYVPWLESQLAHSYDMPAVGRTMALKAAPVSLNLGRPCANTREVPPDNYVSSASQARCGCSVPQGYSHNPTPPIGLGVSLSRPGPVIARARVLSETSDIPLTPALIHAYEENDMKPLKEYDGADRFYSRKELGDHRLDPYAQRHAPLNCRRRSSIGAGSLRIVVEPNKNNQQPLTLHEPRLTLPSSPSFTNSPASLVVAFCSPYLSTAPTSPSLYSPDELHLSPISEGKFGPGKLYPASTTWRNGNTGGGWQALNDFFTSRTVPQLSLRPPNTQKAHTSVLPSALPSPGPFGFAPRLNASWENSNALESLVESVDDPQDDTDKYWIHNPRRSTSNQLNSSPSWVSRRTSDPRLHPIPTIDEDSEPARRARTSTAPLVLNTDMLEDLEDGRLPISSTRQVVNFNPERRGRTTSVPVLAISSPEEVSVEGRRSPRRSTWQHQRISSAHSIASNSRNYHFRQRSVPFIPRQRLGFNVGGLRTISAAENERRSGIERSFAMQPMRRTVEDHEPQIRPMSKFSDSESSMVLVEAESDHIHRIRLGQQRSSALTPILMAAEVHPEPTSVVKDRQSSETAPVGSKSKRLSSQLLDSIKQALPIDRTGSRPQGSSAHYSPAHSWRFVTRLDQAEPAAVAFWLGCILGPWFFVLGGWYLSARRGELGRPVTRPRLPIRHQNMSNANTEPGTPCGLSWVLANRVAACITGPIVIGVFVWSLTLVSNA